MRELIEQRDVASVALGNLRRYLGATGWIGRSPREAVTGSGNMVYDLFSQRVDQRSGPVIMIPHHLHAVDVFQRTRDAVQILCELENRPGQEIIDSINRIRYDLIRSAIPSEQVIDDTIQLSAATDFVSHMRGLLASTATTEKKPRPYFGRLLKESVQFADSCRFGHTYKGSFGFVIESPLPDLEVMPLLADGPPTPFERRVLQRFARGIANVVAAASTRDTAPIVTSVNSGFSANACEQFAELIETVSPAGLGFSFDLSPAWSADRSMDHAEYLVTTLHAEICRSAAKELRRDDTATPVDVAGRVVRLQNQTDPTDLTSQTGEHEIVILWSSSDYGDIQVRTNLSPADYLASVGAHGQGLPIWVSGTLVRLGRQWILNAPHSFRLPRQEELNFEDGQDIS